MENKEADNKTDNTAVSSGHVDENSHDNATAKQPPAHWHSRITDVSEVDVTNVACSQIFNMFTKCFNPSNQFNHIRRNGDFPNCGDILSDWTICMRAAPQKGEQREELLRTMTITKTFVQKSNDVWEYKKVPSWSNADE